MRSSRNTFTHLHIRVRANFVSRAVSHCLSVEEAIGASSQLAPGDSCGDAFDLLRLYKVDVFLSRNKTLINEWDRIAFGSHL